MSKVTWNRIIEVRGKGGAAEGLEYHYPCGHTGWIPADMVLDVLNDPTEWTDGGGLLKMQTCSEGCVQEDEARVKAALNQ